MLIVSCVSFSPVRAIQQLDPYTVQETLSRFPFAQVVPLSGEGAWGVIYANTMGNIHVLRYTEKGWNLEWKLTNLGAKIANFLIDDIEGNGVLELIILVDIIHDDLAGLEYPRAYPLTALVQAVHYMDMFIGHDYEFELRVVIDIGDLHRGNILVPVFQVLPYDYA